MGTVLVMRRMVSVLLVAGLCSLSYAETNEELYEQSYKQAVELVKSGDVEGAKARFEAALEYKPNDLSALEGMMRCDSVLASRKSQAALQQAGQESDTAVLRSRPGKSDIGIRFAVGSAPGVSEWEDDRFGDYDADAGAGFQLEVLGVQRFWSSDEAVAGGVLGAGLFIAGHDGTVGPAEELELNTTVFGFMAQGGLALRLSESIIIEVNPYLGFGGGIQELSESGTVISDGGAVYVMYGVKAGVFLLMGPQAELGLELGAGGFSSTAEYENGDERVYTGSGGRAALALNITF